MTVVNDMNDEDKKLFAGTGRRLTEEEKIRKCELMGVPRRTDADAEEWFKNKTPFLGDNYPPGFNHNVND